MSDVKKLILKHALVNAVAYGGKSTPGAVIGKVVAENPELKKDMQVLAKEVVKIVKQVNSWSLTEQKKELAKFGKIEKPEIEQRVGLPELPNVKGKVVMRFAPNPSGPLHIGHIRQALLNDEYVKRHKGKFILRFDDTDPKSDVKPPMKEAYHWIREDLKWLGVKVSQEAMASSRLETYYKYFEKLLEMGNAYVCTCDANEWRERKERSEPCEHRDDDARMQIERWKKMFKKFKEGEAVARMKTDINHPDPAARDWATFRIIDKPNHVMVGNKYRVWPLLDFASSIDDHEFETTHIIRGVDLNISEVRQRFLYNYFGCRSLVFCNL